MKTASQSTNKFLYVLKFVGCAFGGAVAASIVLIISGFCIFGFHNADKIGHLLDVTNPYVGLMGEIIGCWIFFRSTRKPRK
jgi:hypothetical protein